MTEIVYQVALDISYHKSVPGIMTVIPVNISDSDMQKLIDKNMLWRTNDKDINLSFGYTKLGERFMGTTDQYSSIVDSRSVNSLFFQIIVLCFLIIQEEL